MNNVNATDVTFMSLALADFVAIPSILSSHDYVVAAGMFVLGIVLVVFYHKFGSSTNA